MCRETNMEVIMNNIFMIGIGGSMPDTTVEVHDVLFIVAEQFEDTINEIKDRWYGVPESLHVDSYKVISHIDGYELDLSGSSENDLYFINYGGVIEGVFGEVHDMTFVVASNLEEATSLAKLKMKDFKGMNHIDEITNINKYLDGKQIGFVNAQSKFNQTPDWHGYMPLGK